MIHMAHMVFIMRLSIYSKTINLTVLIAVKWTCLWDCIRHHWLTSTTEIPMCLLSMQQINVIIGVDCLLIWISLLFQFVVRKITIALKSKISKTAVQINSKCSWGKFGTNVTSWLCWGHQMVHWWPFFINSIWRWAGISTKLLLLKWHRNRYYIVHTKEWTMHPKSN